MSRLIMREASSIRWCISESPIMRFYYVLLCEHKNLTHNTHFLRDVQAASEYNIALDHVRGLLHPELPIMRFYYFLSCAQKNSHTQHTTHIF